jgi:hypothetical protein
MTDPSPHQRGRPTSKYRNCQTVLNFWSWAPDGARHQVWLTVGRNVTLTAGALTDIRHEGVRKIFRKTRSPSEPPIASTDLINSAAQLNCCRSTLRAPRHDSPGYRSASRRAPPRSSFRHAKTFSRTNNDLQFAQHKHSACVTLQLL